MDLVHPVVPFVEIILNSLLIESLISLSEEPHGMKDVLSSPENKQNKKILHIISYLESWNVYAIKNNHPLSRKQ